MGFIYKAFKLRKDEHDKSRYLFAMFLFIGFYNTVTEITSLSIFNNRLGPEYFPILFMMLPLFNLAISAAFIPLLHKYPKQKLFKYFIVSIICLQVFNISIVTGTYSLKYVYMFLLLSSMLVIENILFLSILLLQDFVSIESIKRLLPLATASVTSGAILAAVTVKYISGVLPSWVLFSLVTLLLLPALYIADKLYRKYKIIEIEVQERKNVGMMETIAHVGENPFYKTVIVVSIFVVFAYTVNNYLFNVHATSLFSTEGSLLAFIGETQAYQYFAALIMGVLLFSRLVSKIGSTNMVKFILFNVVLSMLFMLGGSGFVFMLIISRVICKQLCLEINYSVAQIFYQPANPRYKENLIIVHNIIVVFAGCILAGIVTILHATGLLNALWLSLLPIFLAVPLFMVWHFRQKGFIGVIEKTMNLSMYSEGPDLRQLVGEMGLNKLIRYCFEKIEKGKPSDVAFALEFIKNVDFKEKAEFTTGAFKRGSVDARLRVVELFFEGHVTIDILTGCIQWMDSLVCGYLLEKLIFRYKNINEDHREKIFDEIKRAFRNEDFSGFPKAIYEYLCEDKKEVYIDIIRPLGISEKNDDITKMLSIISNFVSIEDKVNEQHLAALTEDLRGRRSILGELFEAAAYYDCNSWDMNLIKRILPENCEYKLIKRVTECYSPRVIIDCFSGDEGLTQQTILLHAASQLEPEAARTYYPVYEGALLRLNDTLWDKKRIEEAEGPGKLILLEEMNSIIHTVSAVLIEYLLVFYDAHAIENTYQHILNNEKREMVFEIIRYLLPVQASEDLLRVLNKETGKRTEENSVENTGQYVGSRLILELSKTFCGKMPVEHTGNEYERVFMLKSVGLFKELNYDFLYCIDKIAKRVECLEGEIIIKKGEEADNFYVVCEGELGVYLKQGEMPIARLTAGDAAGELAMLDNGLRTADVICETKAVLLEFKGNEFTDLLKKNGDIAIAIMRILSSRLRGMLDRNVNA